MRTAFLASTLVALAALPAFAQPRAALPAERSTPLPAELARIARDVPDESTPEPTEHYPISNEHRHDLWFSQVRDLGGAFVGVGTDQCYTLAAVQNAELLWVVDFDPLVPLVHRMYGALLPVSDTPDALVARFAPEQRAATEALLTERLASDPEVRDIVAAYGRYRERMHNYLRRARRNVRDGVAATWLSDPALYERVRALHRGGRVIARNGDVTAEGALRAVGRAAQRLGVPLRVIYFSNAEQFFPFSATFQQNLEALHTDERSIVLRTFRERGAPYPTGDRWHYMVQPVADMHARIRDNGYRHSRQIVFDLMAARDRLGANGVSVVDAQVPRRHDAAARRERRERRASP
jgi:hypothetical protein